MNKYGISDTEYKIILRQMKRRKEFRQEYLKLRTNPYLHAQEAGHVFDEAHQRYLAMRATRLERFVPNKGNIIFGICVLILPMVSYGWLITSDRNECEVKIRSGELRYRDRIFKFC